MRQDGPEGRIEQKAQTAETEEYDERDANRQQRDTQMLGQTGRDTGNDPVVTGPVQPAGGWCDGGADGSSSVRSSDRHTFGGPEPRGMSPGIGPPGSQGGLRVGAGSD
ncbi:hypothetical protein Ato02nite_045370 [Paractinoplanes toevensis]|uniref:Uncharacterized protein n=1 Tax=Paractinoplanes toevensis TaxID=571911 RepID=A0A919TEM5_9ACTN|nr:hypothetical protein Ato02nite_045370 [Actinoplanes toevensis]